MEPGQPQFWESAALLVIIVAQLVAPLPLAIRERRLRLEGGPVVRTYLRRAGWWRPIVVGVSTAGGVAVAHELPRSAVGVRHRPRLARRPVPARAQAIPVLPSRHLSIGELAHVTYNSQPPTSGPHFAIPPAPGIDAAAAARPVATPRSTGTSSSSTPPGHRGRPSPGWSRWRRATRATSSSPRTAGYRTGSRWPPGAPGNSGLEYLGPTSTHSSSRCAAGTTTNGSGECTGGRSG